jgi:phosphoglycerate dehydrogenase-like enzyme
MYTDAEKFPLTPELSAEASRHNLDLRFVRGHQPVDMVREGGDCLGIVLFYASVTDDLLEHLPRCRVLARVGTGYDTIDVPSALRRGVTVTYVPDFSTEELSNQVLMFVLAFERRLPFLAAATRLHGWPSAVEFPMPERLSTQSLGILGFGRSGEATARKARAFGLAVRAWTRTPKPDLMDRLGVHHVGLNEALASDYVSIHLPLTKETRGLIDGAALKKFTRGGVLINVSRGAIVDTQALMDALRSGHLGGAGLDVVDPEPLPQQSPLWDMPNVILTCHTAAYTRQAQTSAIAAALADAGAVLSQRPPSHPIPEMAVSI